MTTEQREPLYASTAKPWLKYYDQKYIDMPLPKCSAFEFLCHQNKNHLSETALEYYGRKFTFADLFVNVKKTAAAFRALGVKKGDIIGLTGTTGLAGGDHLHFGISYNGVYVNPCNYVPLY